MSTLFAEVILPVSIEGTFTYNLPDTLVEIAMPGMRVVVPFGKHKFYTGLISKITNHKPQGIEIKPIIEILDETPAVTKRQMEHWKWMSEYYMAYPGEILKAALPAHFRLESKTCFLLNKSFNGFDKLTEAERAILHHLDYEKPVSAQKLQSVFNQKLSYNRLKKLLNLGAITRLEDVKEKYSPRTETYISLSKKTGNDDFLKTTLTTLKRAKKQKELVETLYAEAFGKGESADKKFALQEITGKMGFQRNIVNTLLEKGILMQHNENIQRRALTTETNDAPKKLHQTQEEALNSILENFKTKDTVLLHGVTSSGKTEIYIHLINENLKAGKQVLYLVPEIALSVQLVSRLKKVFGNEIEIYHSRLNNNESYEIWRNVRKGDDVKIVLGVRSSIFLPFSNLGLIIVDEEHDPGFKQFDPSPRYNARDSAIVLARLHEAKCLLGTATPSAESYFNAKSGKYGYVELMQRHGNITLPEIEIVDIKSEYKKRKMKLGFTGPLRLSINLALQNQEQVILFQNRRGYAPYLICTGCGEIPQCQNCNVSLTYHKGFNQLQCHYCGAHKPPPSHCPSCGSENMKQKGLGTEKIEEATQELFPGARTARLDLDTTRGKKSYENILQQFANREIDILIGTQMVSKGLDFEHVSTVGILDADNLLNYPDFRAHERTFQLITQVSGRAGRSKKQGRVVVQTWSPGIPVLNQIRNYRQHDFYFGELSERRDFVYPPYSRFLYVQFRHTNAQTTKASSQYFVQSLKSNADFSVLGPMDPVIPRIKNKFIKQVIIKINKRPSIKHVKAYVLAHLEEMKKHKTLRPVQVSIDVDPL